jgi:hypothetical protein
MLGEERRMSFRRTEKRPNRIVWRMTARAPMGEWVNLDAPLVQPIKTELPEVSSGNWVSSSWDLLHGTEVSDNPDTVPSALWDELFEPPPAPPKPLQR